MSKNACSNKNDRFENFSSNQVKFKDLTVLANFYSNSSMRNQLGRIDDFDKFSPFLLVLEYLQALNHQIEISYFTFSRNYERNKLPGLCLRRHSERRWRDVGSHSKLTSTKKHNRLDRLSR